MLTIGHLTDNLVMPRMTELRLEKDPLLLAGPRAPEACRSANPIGYVCNGAGSPQIVYGCFADTT